MNFGDPNDEGVVTEDDGVNPEADDGAPNVNVEQAEEEEIGFGDEEEDDSAPDLPKRLRAEIKDRDRKLAQAHKRISDLDKRSEEHTSEPQSLMRISYAVS